MKKLIFGLGLLTLFFGACETETIENSTEELNLTAEIDAPQQEPCATMDVLEASIANDPSLVDRYAAVEAFTQKALQGLSPNQRNLNITIPVVFHVIYRTQSENLPLSVLEGQLDALNEDFNLNNPGRTNIPNEFQGVEANVGINFVLQDVIRVQNSRKRRWRPDDSMKFSSSGGSDVVNPQEYLNIWIVNYMPYQGGQILGYAQFPGGNWATDGIVLARNFVGSTARTATHEVGHWANLRHIWGDGGCSVDDFVADTPVSDRYNTGCPSYPTVHCGSNDMTMNFMDYTSDSCMHLFTEGQKARMSTVFQPGGFRAAMGN